MHLSIRVDDLERSLSFYQAFFGQTPHKVRPRYANFDLHDPPLKFAMTEAPVKRGGLGRLDHLGFMVADGQALEEIKQRLIEAGLATFDEEDVTCCYAKQDKVWVHDPDGNAWEIYALTDDMLEEEEDDESGEPMRLDVPRQPEAVGGCDGQEGCC